ncbi:MAG: helix-turn-helix domain-containing protein [Proteobacteria bacterium]|jgi:excisionase family DNA binding protein|nr:helix-turn-helix domain-containing protein [Pseudomonadota bacterium]
MPEILTPKEVANYLKMSVLTVYKHAKEGVIPGFRVGNSWRFDKTKIDELLIGSQVKEDLAGLRSATMRQQ